MSDITKVYSFSVKTADDRALVEHIKKENSKVGRKFSFTIMDALRTIYSPDGVKHNAKTK